MNEGGEIIHTISCDSSASAVISRVCANSSFRLANERGTWVTEAVLCDSPLVFAPGTFLLSCLLLPFWQLTPLLPCVFCYTAATEICAV